MKTIVALTLLSLATELSVKETTWSGEISRFDSAGRGQYYASKIRVPPPFAGSTGVNVTNTCVLAPGKIIWRCCANM